MRCTFQVLEFIVAIKRAIEKGFSVSPCFIDVVNFNMLNKVYGRDFFC